MKQQNQYDIIIVGGGIVGLALALSNAKRGKKVAVFERHPQAAGASVRNFGMVWPIGQPAGDLFDRAMHSREIWMDISRQTGMWARPTGSLHLAYHDDEMAVLEEFATKNIDAGYQIKLVTPTDVRSLSQIAKTEGLKGALWSETEVNIHSRIAIQMVADYIKKKYGVDFYFNTVVNLVSFPSVYTFDNTYEAREHIYICSGADFETLYPSVFREAGITKCKLQMLSTVSQGEDFNMGAMLCAGLTLRHYAAFKDCPTLPELSARYDREEPRYHEYGIHVLVSQNSWGELILGDSHEYGLELNPFDKEEINNLIINYLSTFTQVPDMTVSDRWHGIYPKLHGHSDFVYSPEECVTIVNALSGAGMTLSFGLAEEIVSEKVGLYI
jgi:D-hydroxyproline dehydrogenase subunit beta